MNEEQGQMCVIDDIKTIKQDTYYYCAAACVKMCLNEDRSQDVIFEKLKENTKDKNNWYADPSSVYTYLSKKIKCKRLSDMECDSFIATEKILSCIASTKLSAPMLVSKGKHWVLYSGYQLDDNGFAKGIYVRDPWPTTTSITFYPFGKYFFNEYFSYIDVDGDMKGKVEAFISDNTIDCIKIKKIEAKPGYGGGMAIMDVSCFIDDIIDEDMHNFGFKDYRRIKGGGAYFDNTLVYDEQSDAPKYLLTFIEVNNQLSIAAVDITDRTIIAIIAATSDHYDLFSSESVADKINTKYGVKISRDDVRFIEDEKYSTSCFAPCIDVQGIGRFNLALDELYMYSE